MTHENSTESYEQHCRSGRQRQYRQAVVATLERSAEPMTDRQVLEALKEPDVNNVRPEITRMVQDGFLIEVDKVRCERTGKTVRRTTLASRGPSVSRT
jgi:hypothetical protein